MLTIFSNRRILIAAAIVATLSGCDYRGPRANAYAERGGRA